jgi:hypothetical protein
MYQNFNFQTTLGNVSLDLYKPTKVNLCGINYASELQVQVWTNHEETAGYIVYASIPKKTARYSRIKKHYIDEASAKKYGRQLISEILPIIK